ncbi:MAG: hypothetical protein IPJ82_20425 [Lewinellaceae bacterium]|nr:hypothetical protein [Lewinellaceae bacterium]
MEKSRLLKLLRTLSKEEWKGLKKFVRAPFFNQRKEVIALFDTLEKAIKSGRAVPEKEQIYRQIFGKESYDDHRIRMTMSFLFQVAGQFLTVKDVLDDRLHYRRRMAAIFRRRRLPEQFTGAWLEAESAQQEQPLRNADFFEEKYQLLLEKYRFDVETQSANQIDFQQLSDQLDHAFLARKLWQACFMLSHQTVHNTKYDFGLLEVVMSQMIWPKVSDTPAVAMYYHCYLALANPTEKSHFQEFKDLLMRHGALFPAEELRDLYLLAINFCIRQYNAGNQDYLAEQFDLYKAGFANQYFITDGTLSRYTYQNAATIGLVMRDLEWVERFVHEYRPFLKDEHREALFSFNLARLEYQRREPGKALQLLQRAEYKDLLLNLAAKTLQLKIFYELREFDLLESHLQAVRTFIRRKKVMGYHRENYLNTVYFVQKLLETNLFDKNAKAALCREMEETKSLAEKEWLLRMINPM